MECTKCGAALEADSKFCTRCAAPVAVASDGDSGEARRGAPASGPGQGAKIVGVLLALGTLVLGIVRLTNRPSVQIEVIDTPVVGAAPVPVVPRGAAPEREPTESERALAGTWVATMGFDAPRPATTGGMLVQIQAIRAGLTDAVQRCIWLELYDNLRGFQHECGVVNGEPSVLQQDDPLSGRARPLGVSFRWSFDAGRLSITYDEEMTVTTGDRTTRFVRTELALPQGSPPFDVQQSFPDHPDVPPLTPRFEVFPGTYLD